MISSFPLPRRALGQTGIQVSCLGLGTVKFGRTQNLKYPTAFELPDDASLRRLLDCARESGINLLDTAPAYGISEERLGELLKFSRQDWILSTKAGEEFQVNPATGEAKSHFDFSAKHLRMSVERSLRRLRTDYLDLVLLHSDGEDMQLLTQTDAVETLEKLKQEGWIRAHGASTKTVEGGKLAAKLLDAVMLTYNIQQPEELTVIEACERLQKGVLLKKVFASGQDNSIESALQFALAPKAVSSALVGTINPEHLMENVESALKVNIE
jgi:aryl-alcohol dehydrogenase-like predicted oxidoreductase